MFLVIFMIIPLIAAGIMAGGTLLGGAMNSFFSRRAIDRQNEYNSPINQVNRIRQAGLPMAALTGGLAGNQSTVPQTDPKIGEAIKGGIDTYINTQISKAQLELIQSQKAKTDMETIKTGIDGNIAATHLQTLTSDPTQGDPISYAARMARFEHDAREVSLFAQRNSWQMQQLENQMRADLINDGTLSAITRSQLQSMLNALKLSDQAINRGLIMDTLVEQMKKGGIHLAEALMMAMGMGDLHSPVSFPNINIQGERNYNAQQYHDHKVDVWK